MPVLDGAGQEEQQASDQAVRDIGEQGTVDADSGQRRDAEQNEAHVPNRGVRDQSLQVRWGKTGESGINDPDHGGGADGRRELARPGGEDWNRDAYESV